MTLGKRIQLARLRIDPELTQKRLGTLLRVSDKAVSGWERDEAKPTPSNLVALRQVLKVPYAWLLEGDGPPPAQDDLLARLEDLTPSERAGVASLVEGVIGSFHKRTPAPTTPEPPPAPIRKGRPRKAKGRAA